MENSYGIGITNRFSSFLYSDDDTEEIRPQEEEREKKKKGKSTEKENRTKEVVAETAPSQKTGSTTAPRKGIRDSNQKGSDAVKSGPRAPADGGNKPNRGPRNDRPPYDKDRGVKFTEDDREERNNRKNREDGSREVRSDADFGGRSGPRGGPGGRGNFRGDRRGGPRGGRGGSGDGAGRGGGPGGERGTGGGFRKREFDRQSGSDKSGVKSVDKRDGAGSRNWGNYKDDIEEISATQPAADQNTEEKPSDAEHGEDRETGDEKENQNDSTNGPTEEQPKLMTLDEWKALQQPREKPVFNLRKPGEGEDQAQWKKMVLIKKEKEDENDEEEEEEEEYDCPQRAGRQKQVLEIDFHFTDSRRGGNERRGGRGSRGGPGAREPGPRASAGGDRGTGRGEGERGSGEGRPRESGGGGGGGGGSGRGGFKGFRGGRGGRDDRPTRQAAPKVDDVNDFPSLLG